jgi:hypothetical protein
MSFHTRLASLITTELDSSISVETLVATSIYL